jgi:hypothetical protein
MYRVGTVFFYTGNWGMIGPFTNLKDIILDIVKRAAGAKGELVGWTLFSANLHMHMTDTELP